MYLDIFTLTSISCINNVSHVEMTCHHYVISLCFPHFLSPLRWLCVCEWRQWPNIAFPPLRCLCKTLLILILSSWTAKWRLYYHRCKFIRRHRDVQYIWGNMHTVCAFVVDRSDWRTSFMIASLAIEQSVGWLLKRESKQILKDIGKRIIWNHTNDLQLSHTV